MTNPSVTFNLPNENQDNNFANEKFRILVPYIVRLKGDPEPMIAIKVHTLAVNSYTVLVIKDGDFLWASTPKDYIVISQAEAEVNFTVKNPK